ncbi:glucose-1-phosphate adenylyltransferase subunit GlgD [Aquibacillus halophilus]|uniref:Glucose-1-phosphate adenylyltransferase subunit GlgD n=1 Tax=Aquibacillus halophilus TaxID=930132 RepID=A0A6A8DFA2_9BACI|nr:glucose-1-phosphate adenylyltransferase subunit GlgD [Aquibacillus halophilus]MRH42529.1 glucose-1-phosphate adenylyltransferase subunit GlgD [Aquibacillus halophilus]
MVMNNVLGIIYIANDNNTMHPLTNHRCQSSIPFGSRYRMIDFVLSSMVNSNIQNVSIFTTLKNRSLIDHLGDGNDWDLDRKQDGLFIFPSDSSENSRDITSFYSAMDYLDKSSQEYVLLCYDSLITNIDFRPLYKQHLKSGADVTIMYKDKERNNHLFRNLEIDDFHNIKNLQTKDSKFGSLDIMMLKKQKFIELITNNRHIYRNFNDILREQVNNPLNIKGFRYDGYVNKINTTKQYYDSNMSLLNPKVMKQLFKENNEIHTKLKDEPPAKFTSNSNVKNSLIANGCIIDGEVINSILFRGVHVKKGASIKNSIVMQKCIIGEFAQLDNMVLDKEVILLPYDKFQGSEQSPKVIPKKSAVGTYVN